jgi:hypothetical protein
MFFQLRRLAASIQETVMKVFRIVALCTVTLSFAVTTHSQQPATASARKLDFEAIGKPYVGSPANARIVEALKNVSSDRIRTNIAHLVDFNNRSTISSTETDLKPGTGVFAAADWIRSQFDSYSKDCGGCLEVKFDEFVEQPQTGFNNSHPRIVKPTPLRNVVAILKGTDPAATKRMYLITGHYDTRETDVMNTHDFAPGANDDSSGTAVSMEAARVLSKYRFPATLVFVAVAGEEQGLNGSGHLAKLAKGEGWELEGVLNNDIVGGDSTPGDMLQSKQRIRVFSQGILPSSTIEQVRQILAIGGESESPSRQLARQVLGVGRTYFPPGDLVFHPVMELRLDRFLRGGDHRSFSDEGFAAVRFTEWRENFAHQHQHVRTENGKEYGDLLKFDDFRYIAQTARLNIAVLATLAMSPGVPQQVRVATSNLDNDTILRWDAPKNVAGAVSYEIVWRETAQNDWQRMIDAERFPGPVPNSVRLPVSKDNVFFGVRACSPSGICSQAVAPVVSRE